MSHKTILIIDDQPQFQMELTTALSGVGYVVKNAYDGLGGLRMVAAVKPDLVVLDLILPKKDGIKVLREMKETPGTKEIPVIVLSNLEQSEQVELALRFGAKSYLAKPDYTIEGIVKKIQAAIGDA